MDTQFIRTSRRDGVFTLWLARAPVNVLHVPMMEEIQAALEAAEADPEVRTLLVTGHGMRVFSAGVEVADHSRERMQQTMDAFNRLLCRLQACSLPTTAALNGDCLGGGLELALACDMIVAVPTGRLGHPEIKLGALAAPGILLLQGRMPPNRLVEFMASGEPMDAIEAQRIGLVNRLLAADGFEQECMEFAARFSRMSRPVLRILKRLIAESRGQTLETGVMAASRIYVDELLVLEDAQEGIAAFAQKRPPVWKHR